MFNVYSIKKDRRQTSNGVKNVQSKQGFVPAFVIAIIALLLLGGGGFYAARKGLLKKKSVDDTNTPPGLMMKSPITVTLGAQNNSGESGSALLEDLNGKTKVSIRLSGAPSGVPQPAHIHLGACPAPGAVKYPLSNVSNGNSETMLEISLENLLKELPLAINVHKSAAEAGVYVACGDITDDGMMMDDKGEFMGEKKGESMMGEDDDTMMQGGDAMMGQTKVFKITGQNFAFSQNEIRVKKGDRVKIEFESTGGFHDWTNDTFNARTAQVNTGGKAFVEFVADTTGEFEFYCSVGNHRQMGMKGKLIVEPAPSASLQFTGAKLAGINSPLLDFVKADYDKARASGKLMVLYFYANWCPICREEFPKMQSAFNELTTDRVIAFRVNYNDNETDDAERELAREFGVAYQHTKVFVKNGVRVGKFPDSWSKEKYLSEINKFLSQ
ncbi:MAG: cupredoxin domain-containing protein [bacterium]|nr:cupredoxin domain-containing protein [bacterium]